MCAIYCVKSFNHWLEAFRQPPPLPEPWEPWMDKANIHYWDDDDPGSSSMAQGAFLQKPESKLDLPTLSKKLAEVEARLVKLEKYLRAAGETRIYSGSQTGSRTGSRTGSL